MSDLELQLRLSTLQGELRQLARAVGGKTGKVIEYAANVLTLVARS